MKNAPVKRTRRLNQKVMKPTSGGEDAMVKPKAAAIKTQPKKKPSKSEVKATTVKRNIRKQDEKSSDDASSNENSGVDVKRKKAAVKNKMKPIDGNSSDHDDMSSNENQAVDIKRKKAAVKNKKAPIDKNSSDHDDVSPSRNSAADIKRKKAAVKNKKIPIDENSSDDDDVSSDENSAIDIKRKKAAVKNKMKPIDGNSSDHDDVSSNENLAVDIKRKEAAVKNKKAPIDENSIDHDDLSSKEISAVDAIAPHNSNDGKIFKIMSRIENKLDDFLGDQVNEKRMFGIILHMPFDHVKDINQYNLDLEAIDLFLKFAKYFGCVGGNNDGKIVSNILHQIATPNLLSQFEWQISSSKSFQNLKNIVKVIHAAAKECCSEKYDMTVCGDVIKNVLRNARGGAYKK